VFCTNVQYFYFFCGQGPVVSYYQSGLEAGSPLWIAQMGLRCPSATLSKDGRLERDIVHIDVGFMRVAWEKIGAITGRFKEGRSSKKKACMEGGEKRSGQPVLGRSSRGQLKKRYNSQRAINKTKFSRYLLPYVSGNSPHLLTRRPFQKVVDLPLFSCRKWRLAMRQEGRRSNVRVPLNPANGPHGEQRPDPGNKSRSIAGVIAAQTFHIDMNSEPCEHGCTLNMYGVPFRSRSESGTRKYDVGKFEKSSDHNISFLNALI